MFHRPESLVVDPTKLQNKMYCFLANLELTDTSPFRQSGEKDVIFKQVGL